MYNFFVSQYQTSYLSGARAERLACSVEVFTKCECLHLQQETDVTVRRALILNAHFR
jgi:hypothetical protein